MKSFIVLLFFFAALYSVILNGCDSVTDSKAISVIAPSLTAPNDMDTTVSVTPTFRWEGAADKLEISTNQGLTNIIYSAPVTGNEYVLPSGVLQTGRWYYWHAGVNSGNSLVWSNSIFSFKTAN